METLEKLASAIAASFQARVVAALGRLEERDLARLTVAESSAVATAAMSRQVEVATGRRLAQGAFFRFGYRGVEVCRSADGAPAWPSGVTGSITHTGTFCAVIVGRRDEVGFLGLDAEPVGRRLRRADWRRILAQTEMDTIASMPQ